MPDTKVSASGFTLRPKSIIYPAWRAKLLPLVMFFIACALVVELSWNYSFLVIRLGLLTFDQTRFYIQLPVLIFFPAYFLIRIFFFVFNARYLIDDQGVEAQVGLVSLKLRQPRIRYEDMSGIEIDQTLFQRLLGIGTVLVGSASGDEMEIKMVGVPNPHRIQKIINRERQIKQENLANDPVKLGHYRLVLTD